MVVHPGKGLELGIRFRAKGLRVRVKIMVRVSYQLLTILGITVLKSGYKTRRDNIREDLRQVDLRQGQDQNPRPKTKTKDQRPKTKDQRPKAKRRSVIQETRKDGIQRTSQDKVLDEKIRRKDKTREDATNDKTRQAKPQDKTRREHGKSWGLAKIRG